MRIGLFSDTYLPDVNGVVSSIVTLQKELESKGHEVYVVTSHRAFIKLAKEGNILRLPGLELKWLYGYVLSTPYHFAAREAIKQMNLDVIHVHTEFGVGIFARLVSRSLGIPIVSTYHTMYEDYSHYINKFDISEVDKLTKKVTSSLSKVAGDTCQYVIAPSLKTREALDRYKVATPIAVIPTGLSLQKFDSNNKNEEEIAAIRKEYGISKDDFIIVYLGRIAPEKSIDVVIDSFQCVKSPNAKLLIVGGGPQLEELKAKANRMNLKDKIIFTDKKVSEEVPNYYFLSDVFVSASLSESQGMTYIEALASGLPVFARPDEVLDELIIENKNGYLFSTPEEFANKIDAYIATTPEFKKEIRTNAIEKANIYDSRKFGDAVLSVYQDAIENYESLYTITKIKPYDDCTYIYLENDSEDTTLKILCVIEDYFGYHIRKNGILTREQVASLLEREIKLKAYRGCIKKLQSKDRSVYEIKHYLELNDNLNDEVRNAILLELKEKGYLNDQQYAHDYITRMQIALFGKTKVITDLAKKGISYEIIANELEIISEETETENALILGSKLLKSIHGKSLKMKRSLLKSKLISHGYDKIIAQQVASKIEIEQDLVEEKALLIKTLNKAYDSYANRYDDLKLKNKITKYALTKGFTLEMILDTIKEMEWFNE
ncbi:MAG: RecX family transcriptional regulator [Erysipelotrichaceae bacterium]